jgi:TrmH family RNA methyltransferase
LEGPQAVAEALAYRPELVVELYATPTALERYTDIAQTAVDAGVDVEFVTEHVLETMADTVTPQGIVAVCHQFPTSIRDILRPAPDGPRLVAILEEVRDPGNAGTIIRAADAAGADGVILSGRSVDLYNPKVVRATTGSIFHLPIAVGVELSAVVERARAAGLQVLAADIKGEDLLAARRSGILAHPTAWLFGNEARGLTDEQLALADRVVTVPLYGRAESMNLATAAAVCLYESAFAHRVL